MTDHLNPSSESWAELLAGYVLGDLSSDDMVRVQRYLEQNPAAIAEVEALEATLCLIPFALPDVPVPERIKSQINSQIAAQSQTRSLDQFRDQSRDQSPVTQSGIHPVRSGLRSGLQSELKNKLRSQGWAIAGSMAAVAIGALGLQSYQVNQQLAATRQEIANLHRTQQQWLTAMQERDLNATPVRNPEAVAAVDPSNRRVLNMAGNGLLRGASGQVVVMPSQNRAWLAIEKMPQPPEGKVYHLWAVVNDRKIACIEFVPEPDGSVKAPLPMSRWNRATQVAITLETEASNTEPTGEMVMSGSQL